MNKNKAVTLIELLIAISLLTLILLAGTGIYLSGWNLFRNGQLIAQAQRNAVMPMMDITKNLQRGTSLIGGTGAAIQTLSFTIDDNNTPSDLTDDDTILYTYTTPTPPATTGPITRHTTPPSGPPTTITIANNISACAFTYSDTNPIVTINITATDNNSGNPYILNSTAELRYRRGGA